MVNLKSVYLHDVFQGPVRLSVQEKGQVGVEMDNSQSLIHRWLWKPWVGMPLPEAERFMMS